MPNSRLECTNHTLFQTKMAKKTIPFSAAHTYIVYIMGELQIMSLAAYASETDITAYACETDKRVIYIF